MLLIFERLGDHSQFDIDRLNKRWKYNGENTEYVERELPWRMLFDKCENHKMKPKEDNIKCKACEEVVTRQDIETSRLSNKDFAKVFENQMKLYGFRLKKCQY